LDKPAKEQQKYLDDLINWEAKKKELEGSDEIEAHSNLRITVILSKRKINS